MDYANIAFGIFTIIGCFAGVASLLLWVSTQKFRIRGILNEFYRLAAELDGQMQQRNIDFLYQSSGKLLVFLRQYKEELSVCLANNNWLNSIFDVANDCVGLFHDTSRAKLYFKPLVEHGSSPVDVVYRRTHGLRDTINETERAMFDYRFGPADPQDDPQQQRLQNLEQQMLEDFTTRYFSTKDRLWKLLYEANPLERDTCSMIHKTLEYVWNRQ